MGTTSIIIVVVGCILLIILACWMFKAPKEPKTTVEINKNQTVKIGQTVNGKIRLEIYDDWESKPSDSELNPDNVDDTLNPDLFIDGQYLWDLVLDMNKLDADLREKVTDKLVERGFIKRDDVGDFVLDSKEDFEEEPVNPDPAGGDNIPIGEDGDISEPGNL